MHVGGGAPRAGGQDPGWVGGGGSSSGGWQETANRGGDVSWQGQGGWGGGSPPTPGGVRARGAWPTGPWASQEGAGDVCGVPGISGDLPLGLGTLQEYLQGPRVHAGGHPPSPVDPTLGPQQGGWEKGGWQSPSSVDRNGFAPSGQHHRASAASHPPPAQQADPDSSSSTTFRGILNGVPLADRNAPHSLGPSSQPQVQGRGQGSTQGQGVMGQVPAQGQGVMGQVPAQGQGPWQGQAAGQGPWQGQAAANGQEHIPEHPRWQPQWQPQWHQGVGAQPKAPPPLARGPMLSLVPGLSAGPWALGAPPSAHGHGLTQSQVHGGPSGHGYPSFPMMGYGLPDPGQSQSQGYGHPGQGQDQGYGFPGQGQSYGIATRGGGHGYGPPGRGLAQGQGQDFSLPSRQGDGHDEPFADASAPHLLAQQNRPQAPHGSQAFYGSTAGSGRAAYGPVSGLGGPPERGPPRPTPATTPASPGGSRGSRTEGQGRGQSGQAAGHSATGSAEVRPAAPAGYEASSRGTPEGAAEGGPGSPAAGAGIAADNSGLSPPSPRTSGTPDGGGRAASADDASADGAAGGGSGGGGGAAGGWVGGGAARDGAGAAGGAAARARTARGASPPPPPSRATAGAEGGKSRFRGVSYDKKKGRWRVQIKVASLGKSGVSVGYFETEEAAARAYDRAAIALLGADNPQLQTNYEASAYGLDRVPDLAGKSREEVKKALRSERARGAAARRRSSSRARTSAYVGVGSSHRRNQWQARILVHGRVTHLGYYDSEEAAAKIYDRVAVALHGPAAATNFPLSAYDEPDVAALRGLDREGLQRALGVKPMDKSSRYRGVSRKKGRWEAKVMVDRRWAYRELFDSEIEAARAYDEALRRLKPLEAYSYVNFRKPGEGPPNSSAAAAAAARRVPGAGNLPSSGPRDVGARGDGEGDGGGEPGGGAGGSAVNPASPSAARSLAPASAARPPRPRRAASNSRDASDAEGAAASAGPSYSSPGSPAVVTRGSSARTRGGEALRRQAPGPSALAPASESDASARASHLRSTSEPARGSVFEAMETEGSEDDNDENSDDDDKNGAAGAGGIAKGSGGSDDEEISDLFETSEGDDGDEWAPRSRASPAPRAPISTSRARGSAKSLAGSSRRGSAQRLEAAARRPGSETGADAAARAPAAPPVARPSPPPQQPSRAPGAAPGAGDGPPLPGERRPRSARLARSRASEPDLRAAQGTPSATLASSVPPRGGSRATPGLATTSSPSSSPPQLLGKRSKPGLHRTSSEPGFPPPALGEAAPRGVGVTIGGGLAGPAGARAPLAPRDAAAAAARARHSRHRDLEQEELEERGEALDDDVELFGVDVETLDDRLDPLRPHPPSVGAGGEFFAPEVGGRAGASPRDPDATPETSGGLGLRPLARGPGSALTRPLASPGHPAVAPPARPLAHPTLAQATAAGAASRPPAPPRASPGVPPRWSAPAGRPPPGPPPPRVAPEEARRGAMPRSRSTGSLRLVDPSELPGDGGWGHEVLSDATRSALAALWSGRATGLHDGDDERCEPVGAADATSADGDDLVRGSAGLGALDDDPSLLIGSGGAGTRGPPPGGRDLGEPLEGDGRGGAADPLSHLGGLAAGGAAPRSIDDLGHPALDFVPGDEPPRPQKMRRSVSTSALQAIRAREDTWDGRRRNGGGGLAPPLLGRANELPGLDGGAGPAAGGGGATGGATAGPPEAATPPSGRVYDPSASAVRVGPLGRPVRQSSQFFSSLPTFAEAPDDNRARLSTSSVGSLAGSLVGSFAGSLAGSGSSTEVLIPGGLAEALAGRSVPDDPRQRAATGLSPLSSVGGPDGRPRRQVSPPGGGDDSPAPAYPSAAGGSPSPPAFRGAAPERSPSVLAEHSEGLLAALDEATDAVGGFFLGDDDEGACGGAGHAEPGADLVASLLDDGPILGPPYDDPGLFG